MVTDIPVCSTIFAFAYRTCTHIPVPNYRMSCRYIYTVVKISICQLELGPEWAPACAIEAS
jgi:hypothetical protein